MRSHRSTVVVAPLLFLVATHLLAKEVLVDLYYKDAPFASGGADLTITVPNAYDRPGSGQGNNPPQYPPP